jgi:hypothetical protein
MRHRAEDLLDPKDTSGGIRTYIPDPMDLDLDPKDTSEGICTYITDPMDLEQICR